MKKLDEKRIEEISKNARMNVEIEGFNPSEEATEISKKFLRGEISDKDAKLKILQLHEINQ